MRAKWSTDHAKFDAATYHLYTCIAYVGPDRVIICETFKDSFNPNSQMYRQASANVSPYLSMGCLGATPEQPLQSVQSADEANKLRVKFAIK